MIKHICAALALSLAFLGSHPTLVQAEEVSPGESATELMTPAASVRSPRAWEAAIDGVWLPKSDSSDAGGEIGMSEAKFKISRSIKISPRLSLTPDLTYSHLHVDAPLAARLPGELHAASLGLRGDYLVSPQTSYSLLLAPSLVGDFRQIGGDDLRVRVGVIGRFSTSRRLTLLAGLIYQQGNHSLPVLPILGAIYQPDERWTISFAAPRPGVSYAPSKNLKLNLGAEFFSGEYQLHQASIGAQVIRYQDFRLLGGADFVLFDHLKGELAAGYAFAREFAFYEVFAGNRPDISVDAGFFGRAGLKMDW
jgi:hypothetical protein